MAFVTAKSLKKIERVGKDSGLRRISFYSSGACHITTGVAEGNPTVELQIDFEEMVVRLRSGSGLQNRLIGRVKTSFSCPRAMHSVIIPKKDRKRIIELTKKDDGWWYGSYAEEAYG